MYIQNVYKRQEKSFVNLQLYCNNQKLHYLIILYSKSLNKNLFNILYIYVQFQYIMLSLKIQINLLIKLMQCMIII